MSTAHIAHSDLVTQVIHERGESLLIDVRVPGEYRSEHITGSINVPLDGLLRWAEENRSEFAKHETVFLLCQGGPRSQTARQLLVDAGITNLACVDGGIARWKELGLATEQGSGSLPLDRQIRIGAGSMVLIGTLLAWLVNPWWAVMAGFVGAGLMFAGITGACGMMAMMAMMPWNR